MTCLFFVLRFLFVLRFYGPVNPMGSCRAQSVYLTTCLLGRLSPLSGTSIVHILSPETDNCPSWISGRERMTVENISWSISTKEYCQTRGGGGGDRTRNLLVSSRTRIQLSHQGRHGWKLVRGIVLANSADPDQLASEKSTDLDLHCLSLNMWISIKNQDQVIWLAGNWKWAWHFNVFSMTKVKVCRLQSMTWSEMMSS